MCSMISVPFVYDPFESTRQTHFFFFAAPFGSSSILSMSSLHLTNLFVSPTLEFPLLVWSLTANIVRLC